MFKRLFALFGAHLVMGLSLVVAQVTVSGVITSAEDSLPLAGVSVILKGTSKATFTDAEGKYKLSLTEEEVASGTLLFFYVTFERVELPLNGQTTVSLAMKPENFTTGDVVVTAIGIKRSEKELGYAVQRVGGAEVAGARESNLVNALNSKVAGVQITSTSGTPGASASINIRGSKSINNSNGPLFVVDGVPIDNSYAGSNFTDQSNRALDLNPDDIESLTVLKGPASTALYGIRGANGAVIITTRRAKSGALTVDFSSTATFDQVNKLPEQQQVFAQGINGVYLAPGSGERKSWGGRMDTLGISPANNAKNFFQTGSTFNNYLSLRGGSEKTAFLLSLGQLNQTGIVPNTDLSRTNIRLAGEQSVGSKLKLVASATYTHTSASQGQRGSNLSGVMLGLMRAPESYDLANGSSDPVNDSTAWMNPDGTQRTYYNTYDNPYWSVNKSRVNNEVSRVIGFVEAQYTPADWLSITYRLSTDAYGENFFSYWDKQSSEFADVGGRLLNEQTTFRNLNSDLLVTITHDFGNGLDLKLILGHNYFDTRRYTASQEGYGFVLPNFYDLSNIPGANITADDYLDRRRTVGGLGDLTLGYKGWLFLNTTLRADYASVIASASNPFWSPSASLGFAFTDALQLQSKVLSYGKLRASVARAGNASGSAYATGNYFVQANPTQGQLSYYPNAIIGNAFLEPEYTTPLELGTDLIFFSNKLRTEFTWYTQRSFNQIYDAPIAPSSGYTRAVVNGASIRNRGIELVATVEAVSKGAFTWEVGVNFTRNRNLVEMPDDSSEAINIPLPSVGLASTSSRVISGEPYGVLYGSRWLRSPDGQIVCDANGYPLRDPEDGVIGDPNPDFILGLRNTFGYKSLSFSFLLDFRSGGDMFNGTAGVMKNHGTAKSTENREEEIVFEGVVAQNNPDGSVSYVPNTTPIKQDFGFYGRYPLAGISEASIEDISWVRLREVNVSWRLPKAAAQRLHTHGASLTLTGRNLLLFTRYTGIDPETSLSGAANGQGRDYFNNPNTRSIGLNLSISL